MDHGNCPPIAPIAVRKLLEAEGVPTSHIYMVSGLADTQPLFPDDPYNRGQSPRHHHADA